MKSNNSNTYTRIEELQFLNFLLKTHLSSDVVTNLDVFVTEIQVLIQDPFYLVTIEALLVLSELIAISRPSLDVPGDGKMHSRLSIIYNVSFGQAPTARRRSGRQGRGYHMHVSNNVLISGRSQRFYRSFHQVNATSKNTLVID